MKRGIAIAALLVLCGCSGTSSATRAGAPNRGTPSLDVPAQACPESVPPTATYAARQEPAPTADVRRVHLCGFAAGGGPTKDRPAAGVVLSGPAAAAVGRMVASSRPAPAGAARCTTRQPQLLLRFETSAGLVDVPVVWWRCPNVALVAGQLRVLSRDVATTLTALGGAYVPPNDGDPAPDLAGLPVGEAVRKAAATHHRLEVAGEAVDATVAPGTVLVQDPPAGLAGIGREIDVLLAEPPAPACRTDALSLTYGAGGAGAGNDFGGVVIRDHSDRPCRLTGPIHITGIDDTGAAVTKTLRYAVEPNLVLTPDARPLRPAHGPRPGEFVARLMLSAEYRDGGGPDGLCDQPLVPHAWRLTMPDGAAVVVPNGGPDPGDPDFGSLRTCAGELNRPQPVGHG